VPDLIATLDKGQRSVKGLASGFEHVSTVDLMLTMTTGCPPMHTTVPTPEEVGAAVLKIASSDAGLSPRQCYVEAVREGFRRDWDLSAIDLSAVTRLLRDADYEVDRSTGLLRRAS